jgi:hypothetical protein
LRVKALDRQATDAGTRERGKYHRVAYFHEIDPQLWARPLIAKSRSKLL